MVRGAIKLQGSVHKRNNNMDNRTVSSLDALHCMFALITNSPRMKTPAFIPVVNFV